MIDERAIIGDNLVLGKNSKISAFAIIGNNVQIGDNCIIEEFAKICDGTIIGNNCQICSYTTIAGDPQDLHFDKSTKTSVIIGQGSVVRENSTIHRATISGENTIIGENCYLMANMHIGHDCKIGDNVIIAPMAALGGFVNVGNDTFISGGVMIHQGVRIGRGVIASGNAGLSEDIPPFVNAYLRNGIRGLNLIGLKRRNTPKEDISNLKALYNFVYIKSLSLKANAQQARDLGLDTTLSGKEFLDFILTKGKKIACHTTK